MAARRLIAVRRRAAQTVRNAFAVATFVTRPRGAARQLAGTVQATSRTICGVWALRVGTALGAGVVAAKVERGIAATARARVVHTTRGSPGGRWAVCGGAASGVRYACPASRTECESSVADNAADVRRAARL